MSYEFVKHPRATHMRVSGETPEELFSEALHGVMEYLEPMVSRNNDAEADQVIALEAPDRKMLLENFLGRVSRLARERHELYEKATFIKLTETELAVKLYGRAVEQFNREIKTIDCHGLMARQKESGVWEADIVFDDQK